MESIRILRVQKWMLHTLRNANKKQTILCLIFFSVCGPDKRIGYFCQFDVMYFEPRKWFKKNNNNNNAFDYPAVDSFSQTLCLLINFNVLAGGDSARRMASANVKKKKAKINFWSTKYLTVLDAFFKVDSSDLDTCSFIKGWPEAFWKRKP